MKFAVIVFPGSNCDHDAYYATNVNAGAESVFVWHKETHLPSDIDAVILPGGFSYGDYLRCGAIARFSPIMADVIKFANAGKPVIGICNGFQILIEAGLLPGALLRNRSLHFICDDAFLKVENYDTCFTSGIQRDKVLRIPIAHGEGNYFATPEILDKLEKNRRVVFRYCDADGNVTEAANPNGSLNNIAGIINENGNVLGMMPHPERYSDLALGSDDGIAIFKSLMSFTSN